jgi:uncharacterized protein (DUF1800 family)
MFITQSIDSYIKTPALYPATNLYTLMFAACCGLRLLYMRGYDHVGAFMTLEAVIAENRFGIGARNGDAMPEKPRDWLLNQLERFDPKPPAISALPGRAELAASLLDYQMERRELRQERKAPVAGVAAQTTDVKAVNVGRKEVRNLYTDAAAARLQTSLESSTGFAERLVHFWSNHFAVSVEKLPVIAFAGNYEFEAIRPNIMGKFSDLLLAATRHPAMLVYLDQAQSIGPNSPFAKRAELRRNKEYGLNENLAREILELHTLGARGGYAQADVTEFARALTGNTVAGIGVGPMQKRLMQIGSPGEGVFADELHEPAARQVLGKTYNQNGSAQGIAVLNDLAVHPATAEYIATKLARHFVADIPPPSLISRLEKGFLKSGGDLPSLYRILVDAPEAWLPKQGKFKTPWEWTVSSLRAMNVRALPAGNGQALGMFTQMGQQIWKPGAPAGFSDLGESWAGGAALMRRVEFAGRFAERNAGRIDARTLAPLILREQLSALTTQGIANSDSAAQGLALLLVSPEFLRR